MQLGKSNKDLTTVIEPKIRRISDDEVYLTDDQGNITKQICGAKREGIPAEYPCVEDAGKDTSHVGVGLCSLHDKKLVNSKVSNTYLIEPNIESNEPRTVMDFLMRAEGFGPDHVNSFDHEIQLLQATLMQRLETIGKSVITQREMDSIGRITEKIAKIKKMKAEAVKKSSLDMEVVQKFLKGVLASIKLHSDKKVADRIMKEIIDMVVRPMMAKGEIEGKALISEEELIA